ncbi:MAG TPA: NUDIX domain-containing protein [Acidimicrobiia bacterium]
MTDRFGYGQPRAFACVVRSVGEAPELLVFQHPWEGVQIPKGRVDAGESPVDAACRELEEESGLWMRNPRHIGTIDRRFPHPDTGKEIEETWHCFGFDSSGDLPNRWTHHAVEEDMDFVYFWLPIDGHLGSRIHSYFVEVTDLIEQMFGHTSLSG